ncbi:STAG domain-containing protein [Diplocarpon rosae]|nr:STAG domain-containing protein [Diplocarpon rosae]
MKTTGAVGELRTAQRTPLIEISNNDMASSPVAPRGRRSGRVTKIPEKFVPEAPSSQNGSANFKRKRMDDDGEDDTTDAEEEADDSAEEMESAAEEEIQEARKKAKKTPKPRARKPAAKKPKFNGSVSHDEPLAVKLPARPKKNGKRVAIADKDAEGLYADVFTSGDAAENIVTKWLASYEADNLAALADLVNMVLRSAGCTIEVTSDDVGDDDNVVGKFEDMQAEHQTQNIADYPLISRAKISHTFRETLVDFFDKLIETMHATGVLYREKPLIENIDVWISIMSSSALRPFRHTATLVALTMTSALCRIANKEIENAAKVQRQLDAESRSKGANKARLADFKKRVKTNGDNKAFIESRISGFFDSVYTHRYRDVDPRIRIECAEAMGTWMLTLPDVFFDGSYLRYMGWMLSDIHGPMRLEVVKQLQKLMKSLNPGGLRHFVERFRPRMIEMAVRDSEPSVRAAVVELMDSIRQEGMLEPDDIDTIGKLIFDSEPKVRNAVVGFFAENINDVYDSKVEELGGDEAIEDLLAVDDNEDYDTPRAGWIRLKCLVESLLSYDTQDQEEIPSQINADFLDVHGLESRFTLAAQALYEKLPVLRDWEVLAGYLLYDHTSADASNDAEISVREGFRPDEKEELVLLEILNAVIKVNLTRIDEVLSRSRSASAKEGAIEAKENIGRRLASLIPRLLKRYGADPRSVTVVLRLEHVLDPSVFQELRQDTTVYAQMLDEISTQFNGHADQGVLAEAAAAFLHARGHEELEEIAESKISSLWEDTANSLRKINKAGDVSRRGSLPEKVLIELSHTMSRLEQLSTIASSVDILEEASTLSSEPLPIVILLDIIARGVFEAPNDDEDIDNTEDQIVLSAIKSSMFYFMWKIRALLNGLAAGTQISDIDVDNLKEWKDTFITNLTSVFSSRSSLDLVRLVGAGTILDAHVLFRTLRSAEEPETESQDKDDPHWLSLAQHCSPEVQQELVGIFDSLEKQFAKKAKRKLTEPGEDEEPEDFDEEPEDDEEDATDSERQAEILTAERDLCELTGKLVIAITAQVIDAQGPHKGKLRARITRNRQRLGPNFKEVLAFLDEPKPKAKKTHQSKEKQAAGNARKKPVLSKELVEEEEEEEEDDPFAHVEPEEGTVEDLRRRELLEDDPEGSIEGNDDPPDGGTEDDEDDIMGD